MVVALSNWWTNIFSRYSFPLCAITKVLVTIPATRGITTNRNTLRNNVLYGTVTFDTPRKISQLAQTPPGLSGRWLPPVPLYMLGYHWSIYSRQKPWLCRGQLRAIPLRQDTAWPVQVQWTPLKITNKKKLAIPYIVNGLINQLVIHVINKPFGFFPASLILLKSTFIIIG